MRIVAQKLSETWKQQVVVDNRPGATGVIGTQLAASSKPDGYTILAISGSSVILNHILNPKLPGDVQKDFVPISLIAIGENVLVVNPEVPAGTLNEFIALVRANPGKYNFTSSGIGSTAHLIAELFMQNSATKMVHIPYKGDSDAALAVVSGQAHINFATVASTLPFIRKGQLRAVAVATLTPVESLPEVPTIASIFPRFDTNTWIGLATPTGTDPAIVARFENATRAVLNSTETREKIRSLGLTPAGTTSQELADHIRNEFTKWRSLVQAANIQIQ